MTYSVNQLRDFSSLFYRSEVCRWFKDDFESIDLKLQRYRLIEKNQGNSYLNILKQAYKILEKHYPNEYILKNEFLNQWLKHKLGSNNSIIFNELRLGKAIADLVMFNGKSQVFEIKTILDKEYRLTNQLQEYKKLFNEVYLIVPNGLLSKYIEFDKHIGIITYDSNSKNFELIRKSIFNNNVDVNVLMEVLHTKEYLDIARKYYVDFPEMNSFNQFNICKNLISKIPNNVLNELFINTMKERKINNLFFNKINREFNQKGIAMYFPYLRARQFELITLRELVAEGALQEIMPVIEPVKESFNNLDIAHKIFLENDFSLYLIVNPFEGKASGDTNVFLDYIDSIDNSKYLPAFHYSDNLAYINNKIEEYSLTDCLLICLDNFSDEDGFRELCQNPAVSRIMLLEPNKFRSLDRFVKRLDKFYIRLDDLFEKQQRNADFLEIPAHKLTEEHLYYSEEGYNGFSDFTILPNEFMEGGKF